MPNADDILWLKKQFQDKINAATNGTPFKIDLIVAIACQETGYIWQVLKRKNISINRILELCVGDTLDVNKGRTAFPKTKADLLATPNGDQMFRIARQALIDLAEYIPGYESAAKNPSKFCHGFGMFQYDLQFFPKDQVYFLQKQYANFDFSLEKCVKELERVVTRLGWQQKESFTDYEAACVGIAYNAGHFVPSKGLKQGFYDGKRYYGEALLDYIRMSKTVEIVNPHSELLAGPAIVALPTTVQAAGPYYEVDVREAMLRIRSTPAIDKEKPNANVIANLPDGHIVRAISEKKVKGSLEIETSLLGKH